MLAPLKVSVPVPALVNPRVPAPLVKVPLKVVLELLPPAVKVAELAALLLVTVPVPANEPTVLEKLARSKVEVTVKAELALKAVVEPAFNVPALTVVAPLYVLAPEIVRVPVPFLVNPRVPAPSVKVPLKLVLELLPPVVKVAEVVEVLLVTVPVPANEPTVLEKLARSRVAFTVKAELALKAVVEPACNVPALTFVTPE